MYQLQEAQASFENQIDEVIQQRTQLHELRKKFVKHFTFKRIRNMSIEDYAIGFGKPITGHNFCYTLERELDGLGRTLGATASKFGIYYSKDDRELKITRRWGITEEQVFDAIKDAILELIDAGSKNDLNVIASNQLSRMFKGKILATYFPDQYLNVFSKDHLNYFITKLNLDTIDIISSDAIYKKKVLADFKNQDPVMKNWSLDIFSYFLYNYYPGRPPHPDNKLTDSLSYYRVPDFPPNPLPSFVELQMFPPEIFEQSKVGDKSSSNPDYEAEYRRQKHLGDRGEKIILELEYRRLTDAGKSDLAKKVKKAKFDYEGYDIFSYEVDGSPRYIEVKATTAKVGKVSFFLSANEYKKANELKNYHVYIVFEILKSKPKVWILGNPFNPHIDNIVMKPTNYRIDINAK